MYPVYNCHRLPPVNNEVSSYLLNKGNYDLTGMTVRGISTYDNLEAEVYQEMNKVIKKKISVAVIPQEDLLFE